MSQDDEAMFDENQEEDVVQEDTAPAPDPYNGMDPEVARYVLEQTKKVVGEGGTADQVYDYLREGYRVKNETPSGDASGSTDEIDDDMPITAGDARKLAQKEVEKFKLDQQKRDDVDRREVEISNAIASAGVKAPEDQVACMGYVKQLEGRIGPVAAARDWAKRYLKRASAVHDTRSGGVRRSSGEIRQGEREPTREEDIEDVESRLFGRAGREDLSKALSDLR